MKHSIVARAAIGSATSVAAILPLTACGNNSSASSPSTVPSIATPTGAPPSSPTSSRSRGEYRDGTYTVRGVYGGAPSYMTITLTLAGGTISDVEVEPMPENNDTSRGYQERFAAAMPDEVAGKSIDGLRVGKIAGASGCADGFNDALAKIREQAAGT